MGVYLLGLNVQNVIKIWMTIIFHFLVFLFISGIYKMSNGICTDDPDELLNEWLGELENLIGVSFKLIFIVGLSLTNMRSSIIQN